MVISESFFSIPPKATLCLALSGREWAWGMTARFLERQNYPHHLIQLKILDTSGSESFRDMIQKWLADCDYPNPMIESKRLADSGLADQDRPSHTTEVRRVCAEIYARLSTNLTTPLVFTLEDDILPPLDVYEKLHRYISDEIVSASVFYLGRMVADPIAWNWTEHQSPQSAIPARGVVKVGGHGFGAAVFRADIFTPERFTTGRPHEDFDYNFFHRLILVEGRCAVVDWECAARHYSDATHWVQTPETSLALRLLKGAEVSIFIVHLNPYDRHGGAERLAESLISEQVSNGHRSVALVGRKDFADTPAFSFDLDPDLEKRAQLHQDGWPDYEFRGSHRLPEHPIVRQASVIHAHNLSQGWFHPFSLIALSQSRPVIWSIHDMQALTGYCSHALDCPRWQTGCGECPDLTKPGAKLAFDNTAALWRDKKLVSDNSRLWIVGASTWMVANLKRSLLANHPIHHIPNGIDTSVFHPTDRCAMREKFGLPLDALILGSLARSGILSHPWKGGGHALSVLDALHLEHPTLIFLNVGSEEQNERPWIRSLIPASKEHLCEILGTMDFFLYPSIADTAPLVVLEALACGLPVVGFATGGIPDMVTAEEGFLVSTDDTPSLLEATRTLANDAGLRVRMGSAARARAVSKFDLTIMSAAYERLYHEAIVAHAGKNLPLQTVSPLEHSYFEEWRQSQSELVLAKNKLRGVRKKMERNEGQLSQLATHPLVRLGKRLRLFPGSLRKLIEEKKSSQS